MRDIKFHGKRIDNGEWVIGSLYQDFDMPESASIIPVGCLEHRYKDKFTVTAFDVDFKTVGQYTGLRDKKGKDIYEGDIIEDILTAEKEVIEFHGNMFALVSYKSRFFFTVFRSDEKQIIGNIYDNPELLEGER